MQRTPAPRRPADRRPPRLVATAGLHGSASTWVFNVVRELLIAAVGADQVFSRYGDEAAELPDPEALGVRCVVFKTHHGSAGLDERLAAEKALIVLSVRDPRDAAISMAQRFDAPLPQAARWLAADCARIGRLASEGHMLLRYEDRFFEDAAAPGRLARTLGLALAPGVRGAIFARYRTGAMRDFAYRLGELPPDRVEEAHGRLFDTVTHIHSTHIGDARSGKWRDLPPDDQAALTRFFRPFLDRFGY